MSSDKKLGIIELLQRVGEDNVRLQFVASSLSNILTKKNGDVSVTFFTSPQFITPNDVMAPKMRNVGIVLWLPSELVEAAQAAHAAAPPPEQAPEQRRTTEPE